MTTNRGAILAGVKAGGDGQSLCWLAPTGTTAPTDSSTVLGVGWLDCGYVTTDGLVAAVDEDQENIGAFGTLDPVRTLVTSSTKTFGLSFLESNPNVLCAYHRLELGSITPDETGAFDFEATTEALPTYAAVFDMVDGVNHMRAYCPNVQVTERDNIEVSGGAPIAYPVTFTAYPDDTGVPVHWFYKVVSLAADES